MLEIKVLGSGCAKCVKTAERIQNVAKTHNIDVHVVKETSPEAMLQYGVMNTPAVVVNNKLVHSGSVPDIGMIENWLK